ncbi:hypothetical protein QZH41_002106 [Actinostola sp. cb2023]|nr:hypothetical protein QZH41_002106 [Actinostola sp. cb2023]
MDDESSASRKDELRKEEVEEPPDKKKHVYLENGYHDDDGAEVTEDEIRCGIVDTKAPEKHTFWFKRVFTDLEHHIDDVISGKFIDKTGDNVDQINEEAQCLLNELREKDLPSSITDENIIQYDVQWRTNGIDQESAEHAQYVQKLCTDVHEKLTAMISEGIAEDEVNGMRDPLVQEVVQHLSFCQTKCTAFHGRQEFLESIKEGLLGNDKRVVVLHGESGCGKTSLVAKVAMEVKSWFKDEPLTMVCRFIGTTPDSSSIRCLLRSVCLQLEAAGLISTKPPEDLQSLMDFLPECLETASQKSKLVLILDSLDQLSIEDGGRTLDWLPRDLPDNVYVVLSTLPALHYQCLPNLKAKFPIECLLEVPQMALEESAVILDNWLKAAQRTLQQEQKNKVLTSFQECPLPLYLKLAFDESCRWKSYTPFKEWHLPPNIRDIIHSLFDRVERIHGNILVSHALGYITASKNGLTETELEDLLSLDDEVLNDVFQYWTPPIRRLPPLLWKRIRSDVRDYLIDRGADGSRVRYLGDEHQSRKLHANMADYFLGRWSDGKEKSFLDKNGEERAENRLVATQPLLFDTSDDKPIFNVRKLNELPFHLFFAAEYNNMKDEVLCNFEFLLAKLRASSLENVLDDFSLFLKVNPTDLDVKMLEECLILSSYALSLEPKQLATQILGRMMTFQEKEEEYPYLCKVLRQAWNPSVPYFLPNQKCLTSPGGRLLFSLNLGRSIKDQRYFISIGNDNRTLAVTSSISKALEIKIVDYHCGKQLRKFTLTSPPAMARCK